MRSSEENCFADWVSGRRTGSITLLVMLALSMLVPSVPAAAQDPFGIIGDIVDQATDALSSDEPPSNASAGQIDNGVGATALVEEVVGIRSPGIAAFSYLQPGQQIDLGSQGNIRLTYFSSCTVEVIRGGRATIGTVASKVTGGKVERTTTQCHAQEVAVHSSATEFGASVKRVTLFNAAVWAEATVSTQKPSFAWNGGAAKLRIVELDSPEPRLVWQGSVKGSVITYPKGAAPLQIGVPYRVEIETAGRPPAATVFSVDPGYMGNGEKTDVVNVAR
jgi:hypothetical protein